MCPMLYVGTADELVLEPSPDLRLDHVRPDRRDVVKWFSQPVVRFV